MPNLDHYLAVDGGVPTLLEQHGLVQDRECLSAMIADYADGPRQTVNGGVDSGPRPDPQNFFLFWLPNRLTNLAMEAGQAPAEGRLDMTTAEGFGRSMWLAHLSGYYFGVWLRLMLSDCDRPRRASAMTDAGLAHSYGRFVDPIVAVATRGTDEAALAAVLRSLRRSIKLPNSRVAGDLVMSLSLPAGSEVGIFGFDTSWLHHILPPSRNAPRDARPFSEPFFTSDPSRLLDATYAIPEEPYLSNARVGFDSLEVDDPDVSRRLAVAVNGKRGQSSLLAHQRRWYRFAKLLYARGIPGGTVYRGVPQDQYDRLVTWAAYSIMIPQAAALNALVAHATADAALARRQLRARALWWALVTTYCHSVADARHDGRSLGEVFPDLR